VPAFKSDPAYRWLGYSADLPSPLILKMLIRLEGAHPFYVSIFGGVAHLRDFAPQFFDTEVSNFAPSGRSGVGGTQSSQLPLLE
jgi:hypothetical protein